MQFKIQEETIETSKSNASGTEGDPVHVNNQIIIEAKRDLCWTGPLKDILSTPPAASRDTFH